MYDDEHDDAGGGADVAIRPPSLFLGGLTAACILELLWPVGPGLAQGNWKAVGSGLVLAVLGGFVIMRAIGTFTAAGTSYRFDDPTDALVTTGLYGFSRNPIYIGLATFYGGLAIALTSGWALILLPGLILLLRRFVIEPEERFMADRFGDDFEAYRKRVPRWL